MKTPVQEYPKTSSTGSSRVGSFIICLIALTCLATSSRAFEYEVDGTLTQTTYQNNGTNSSETESFTVYVRDCSWLIKITDSGSGFAREYGSTNGSEIYRYSKSSGGFSPGQGLIQSNSLPVGWLDKDIEGHLYLMFASQCYWPKLNSDQLTPIYDWHASAGMHAQNQRVSAEWKLLNGLGSLPQEVIYFDLLNKTNAIYKITGSKSVGGMLIPTGFVFERNENSRLDKHIDVEVSAIREVCSRTYLLPTPDAGALVVDSRFETQEPNHLPTYRNPVAGKWLSVEEARILTGIPATTKTSVQSRTSARAADSMFSSRTDTAAPVLSLAIRCTNDVVKVGDEISIEFKITNRGTNDYKYANRTYDRSGRMGEYSLTATNEFGEAVPDPRANDKTVWMAGGLFTYATLKPGESFTKIIPLNRWALVKDAGSYTVTGTYPSEMYSTNYITLRSEPITVTVLPRSPAEMDAYIADLTNQFNAILTSLPSSKQTRPPVRGLDELAMKLMYTCNPKIVPSLLQSLYANEGNSSFWTSEAIQFYLPHSEEIKKALLDTASQRGLGANSTMASLLKENNCTKEEMKPLITRSLASTNEEDWAAGAGLAQQYGDDDFTERLVAIAKTPRNNAQTAAITALAYNRTDEGVKTLKELLNDPHQNIWTPLAFAIQNAYNYRSDATGRPLRPDDFTAEDLKPLIEHLMSPDDKTAGIYTALGLIGQFGGDEYTAQLISIATSTDNNARNSAIYPLALNRTDEGVKALKALLSDRDPKVVKMTEDAIRNAYTAHGNSRGRLLKPDDFDTKYQQPKPEK